MIRFSCASCNHLLRAPAELAGKKGKCARCGAVNLVPEAVSVEVSRAPGPSPFRSTADLEARAIEGSVELEGTRFLANGEGAAAIAPRSGEFFEQVSPRISDVIEVLDSGESEPPQPTPVARIGVGQEALERLSSRATLPALPFDDQPTDVGRRAILGALVVGMVLGFCLGVLASKWVL